MEYDFGRREARSDVDESRNDRLHIRWPWRFNGRRGWLGGKHGSHACNANRLFPRGQLLGAQDAGRKKANEDRQACNSIFHEPPSSSGRESHEFG
jgi:hypothetical protein